MDTTINDLDAWLATLPPPLDEDGEVIETVDDGADDALAAALAFEEALRPLGIGAARAGQPEAEMSDDAWFRANPGRMSRVRACRPEEASLYPWMRGERFAIVRTFPTDPRPSAQIYPLSAVGGVLPPNTEAGAHQALEAVRFAR